MKVKLLILGIFGLGIIILLSIINSPGSFMLPIYAPEDFDPDGVDSTLVNKSVPCKIPNFAFVNQNGEVVTNDLFQDKIYVANFFFTSCPSICPILTKHMKNIQEEFIVNDDVLLLSHTVDPERDSVSVLNAYADLHGIMNEKWHLVTGRKEDIYAISRKGYFAISYVPTLEDNSFIHSETFILIDKEQRIRGVYNGTILHDVNRLIEDIYTLKKDYI